MDHGALPGPENMAWDHTLAAWCPEGVGVLRFYRWDRPTLSLGRNEPAAGVCTPEGVEAAGVGLVRRPTGGRAVLHHRELTYAVIVPDRGLGGPRDAYALINRALARGLVHLGVEARVAEDGTVLTPDAGPCFQSPAPGEVIAGSGKLVGSAQVRLEGSLMQHGSILLHNDQGMIDALGGANRGGAGSPVALADVLPEVPEVSQLTEAVVRGFAQTLPGRWPRDWRAGGPEGTMAAPELPSRPDPGLLQRYASSEWTWRR